MKKALPEMEHTTWPVSDLRPHPKQTEYFRSLTSAAISALASDIKVNGLRAPLEITPEGVVISGHQRLRAVRELSWREVSVVVRHDLAARGEDAVERRLLECNLNSRHLSILEFARTYKRLKELASSAPRRNGVGDLRDEIGRRLGKSGRQLDRLVPLLDLPREIREAVDAKKIPVKSATQLAKLPKEAQNKVAAAIREGGNVRQAVFNQRNRFGLIGRIAPTGEQLKAQLRSVLLQGRRLAEDRAELQALVRKDQVPLIQALVEFLIGLCHPYEGSKANGKPRKTKKKSGHRDSDL